MGTGWSEMGSVPAGVVVGVGLGMLAGAAGRVLLGRLRRGTRIPPPWCELAVGALWGALAGAVAARVVPVGWVPLWALAAWFAVVASAVDVRHHRLPDALTLPALPAALALVVPLGWAAVGRAAAGAAMLAGAYLLVHAVAPDALGLGDVKLAAPVGAVLAAGSWAALVLGCALTAVLGGTWAAVVAVRRGRGARAAPPGTRPRGRELPHGPVMVAAALLTSGATAVGAGLAGAVGAVGAG